jgi:hypothetical protein
LDGFAPTPREKELVDVVVCDGDRVGCGYPSLDFAVAAGNRDAATHRIDTT